MGLVWSGAGSERTPALQVNKKHNSKLVNTLFLLLSQEDKLFLIFPQGNILLQDEKLLLRLYCGLVADINIQGGLSFELAGQIQVSLWSRTANSLVENK